MKTRSMSTDKSENKTLTEFQTLEVVNNFTNIDLNLQKNSSKNYYEAFDNKNNLAKKCPKRRELGNRGYVKKMRKVPFLGIFCAIMYAFFMSTSVALLKTVPNLHPIAVLFYRSIIQGLVFLFISIYNSKSLLGIVGERIPLAGRAVSGMMNQVCWYTSVKYISLTDSSAIYYSAPAFVTVLAFFMLKEKFGLFECLSVLITIGGVTLVSKPGFLPFFDTKSTTDIAFAKTLQLNKTFIQSSIINQTFTNATLQSDIMALNDQSVSNYINNNENYHVIGMILALVGAITFALSNIYIRQMKKTPVEITAFWFALVTICSGAPLMCLLNVMTLPRNLTEWIVVIIVGIFAVLGQVAFTLALKIEKAGPVSVAQTLNIVIVLFYQIVFFDESITFTSLIGVLFIIISVMIIGFKDILSENQLFKKIIKKFFKSSNGQFKLDNSLIKNNISKPVSQNKNLNYSQPNSIKVLHINNSVKTNLNQESFAKSICIAGNCKNNICFTEQNNINENHNTELSCSPKYIIYNKDDIY